MVLWNCQSGERTHPTQTQFRLETGFGLYLIPNSLLTFSYCHGGCSLASGVLHTSPEFHHLQYHWNKSFYHSTWCVQSSNIWKMLCHLCTINSNLCRNNQFTIITYNMPSTAPPVSQYWVHCLTPPRGRAVQLGLWDFCPAFREKTH